MRNVFLKVFLLWVLFDVNAQLKINEIMSNNVSAVLDESFNYSMWVEIYNSSATKTYYFSSFYFTDDRTNPTKWKPVFQAAAPNSFTVLWFEREDIYKHANFKLDPSGGKLFLFDLTLQLVDSVVYPPQIRNVSWGRKADGGNEWGYFEQFSFRSSNNTKQSLIEKCVKPVFTVSGGFYSSVMNIGFQNPQVGDTIYYTLNGAEPTKENAIRYTPGNQITFNSTSIVRAKSISAKRLSSNIVTNTYFIGERNMKLPVVSIVTQQSNLTDNVIGIYVVGTNGITGNGMTTPANWNQDWDRPVNFELYDTTNVYRINQELDVSISGAWSRMNGQKSLIISPRNKFGKNTLDYDFFKMNKPNRKYKDIQLRNSGNDFFYLMMRDAFMESLLINRMDIDYIAYEPAVCFMNGVYYGIQNLRERTNSDFIYSNYGYNPEDILLLETWSIQYNGEYQKLSNYISNNNTSNDNVYNEVGKMMDVDNYANYLISEIYYGNTDWPANNVKIWKKNDGGKWRWLLYDTDFGFNLYDTNLHNFNALTYALGEMTDRVPESWSTLLFRRLILNEQFKNKFIDRSCIHLSSTFEPERVNHILDSMGSKIKNELVYHKLKWGTNRDYDSDIVNMKIFSANRSAKILEFISNRFLGSAAVKTLSLKSNIPNATYKLNSENIQDEALNLKYFVNRPFTINALPVIGQVFKYWEISTQQLNAEIIPWGNTWKYFDGNSIPASNWFSNLYSDAEWKSGAAQLGYGGKGERTTIDYGGEPTNKYTTAYFRKTITLSDTEHENNFKISIFVDDAAAVYVNGQEIGRYNLAFGPLNFNTLAATYNNGEYATFSIPKTLIIEGENVIAVEVHQNAVTSSDLIFNLQMICDRVSDIRVVNTQAYSSVLYGDLSVKAIYEVSPEQVIETPTVVINEVLPANSMIPDEFGNLDDYLELYNYGTEDVNIAGWYLTDNPVNLYFYQFPLNDSLKTNIPAKGRLIVWTDNQPEQGILHASFKMSKDGEKVILSLKNEINQIQIVDSVTFPALGYNLTYSRVPDGASNWFVRNTTFNFTNGVVSSTQSPKSIIRVYPTLVKTDFNVYNASGKLLTVTDLTGKLMIRRKITSDIENVSTTYLKSGLYILSIENISQKLIKL